MKRAAISVACFLMVPLAACHPLPGGHPGESGPLEAKVLDFQADGFAQNHGGAISDEPIDPVAVFGRRGKTPEPVGKDVSYVAVSTYSGCDLARGATLWRKGDDLRVKFEFEPVDWATDGDIVCIRSFEPYVQFAVDSELVEGVRTIDGQPSLPIPPPSPPWGPVAEIELSLTPVAAVEDGSARAGDTVKLTCTPDGGSHPTPVAACDSLRAVGFDFDQLPSTGTPCILIYDPHVAKATGSLQMSPTGPVRLVEYEETFSNRCVASVETDNVFNF